MQELETSIREQQDKQIFEAIQKFGVDVDRDELIKALAYDRDQYDKGYSDGRDDAQRWISVEERLPDIGEDCALYVRCGDVSFVRTGWRMKNGKWICPSDSLYGYEVTHWMLLPQPPEPTP